MPGPDVTRITDTLYHINPPKETFTYSVKHIADLFFVHTLKSALEI
jgi:hypothetical protein